MHYLQLFPQHNNFFKPQRLVWQETEPSEATEAKEEPSWEEVLESADFIKDIRQTCDTAKEEGREALECRIRSLMEGKELVKFKRFVDELGEKFLKQLPEPKYRYAKETSKRLEALKEITDLDAIMTRFKEAKDYTIVPYRRGKTPAMTVFEYPDGTTEKYPLELSYIKKRRSFGKGLKAIRKGLAKRVAAREGRKEEEKIEGEYINLEELVARSHYLNTPDSAYYELKNITKSLPDDLLESLSMPLSQIADVLSNARVQYNAKGNCDIDINESEEARVEKAEEIENILDKYFGGDFLDSSSGAQDQQVQDILKIVTAFGLD